MTYAFAAALLAVGIMAEAAAAEAPGYYIGAHAGRNNPDGWRPSVDLGAGTAFEGEATLRRGSHAGPVAGRERGHLRYEAEYARGQLRFTRLAL